MTFHSALLRSTCIAAVALLGLTRSTAQGVDDCSQVVADPLAIGGTLSWTGDNSNATITGDFAPGSVLESFGIPVMWHAFTTTACADITIDYCGSPSVFVDFWNVLATTCPATNALVVPHLYEYTSCGDGNPTILPVESSLNPLGSIAWLAAAATLNPAAALLIGFITGLTRALFQTHQLFTSVQFALIALASHLFFQRNYVGRVYAALRNPFINGLSLSLAHVPLFALAAGVSIAATITSMSSFDIGMTTAGLYFWPMVLEGLVAGGAISLVYYLLPDWKPILPPEVGLPWRQHITTTLVRHFALFSLILLFIAALVTTLLSISVARKLVISQMAQSTERATERVEQFIELRQDILLAYSQNEGLTNNNPDDNHSVVRQLFDSGDLFTAILLMGADGSVLSSEPGGLSLTAWEQSSIPGIVSGGPMTLSQAQISNTAEGRYVISFLTPVNNGSTVLIGRVDKAQLDVLGAATDNPGLTFVTDGADAIIADPLGGRHTQAWKPNPPEDVAVADDAAATGTVYEEWSTATGSRQLVLKVHVAVGEVGRWLPRLLRWALHGLRHHPKLIHLSTGGLLGWIRLRWRLHGLRFTSLGSTSLRSTSLRPTRLMSKRLRSRRLRTKAGMRLREETRWDTWAEPSGHADSDDQLGEGAAVYQRGSSGLPLVRATRE